MCLFQHSNTYWVVGKTEKFLCRKIRHDFSDDPTDFVPHFFFLAPAFLKFFFQKKTFPERDSERNKVQNVIKQRPALLLLSEVSLAETQDILETRCQGFCEGIFSGSKEALCKTANISLDFIVTLEKPRKVWLQFYLISGFS